VTEVADTGEHHCKVMMIRGGNYISIANRAARLCDRRRACFSG
jgi:hypothetical protein